MKYTGLVGDWCNFQNSLVWKEDWKMIQLSQFVASQISKIMSPTPVHGTNKEPQHSLISQTCQAHIKSYC